MTLEGIEGSGKSTLAETLAGELEQQGHGVLVTVEPGGGEAGSVIRNLLLDTTMSLSPRAELLLFEAARAEHVGTRILPALQRGEIVICDRFTDSTLAYQGYGRGISLEIIRQINSFAAEGLVPDITLLLDLDVQAGLARQRKRDRISTEDSRFHEAVRRGFLELAAGEPERIVVLDAALEAAEVGRMALAAVNGRLRRRAS